MLFALLWATASKLARAWRRPSGGSPRRRLTLRRRSCAAPIEARRCITPAKPSNGCALCCARCEWRFPKGFSARKTAASPPPDGLFRRCATCMCNCARWANSRPQPASPAITSGANCCAGSLPSSAASRPCARRCERCWTFPGRALPPGLCAKPPQKTWSPALNAFTNRGASPSKPPARRPRPPICTNGARSPNCSATAWS